MNNEIQFLLYNSPEGGENAQVLVKDETIWMTQKAISQLFDCTVDNVGLHLRNIFKEGELSEISTTEKFSVVQKEGKRNVNRELTFYNLDAIISVGYRVNSIKATNFRKWATGILKEYIHKGFILDDERLKQGKEIFGKDYFKELLERVRSIRASERRIWQQITDIYAECSTDYDKQAPTTREFYSMIQNRFHYAITGDRLQLRLYTQKPTTTKNTWD